MEIPEKGGVLYALFLFKTLDYTVTVYFKMIELINLAKKGEQIGRKD